LSADPCYDLNFQVQIETGLDLSSARIQQAVEWVLRSHEIVPGTGISVVITDDETIRRLNHQFRDVDAPTDVLSFPDEPVPGETEPYLGDVILSLPTIRRQAEAEAHTLSDELVLAVIHGTLHVLGYDHDTPERQARMWAKQTEALQAMGVRIVVPPFEFSGEGDSNGAG
jgi:probable rRNA maturation factor